MALFRHFTERVSTTPVPTSLPVGSEEAQKFYASPVQYHDEDAHRMVEEFSAGA